MLPAAVLAAVVVLSGCTPAPHTVTPAPVPSSTPVFASDADALAAATAAYAKYLEVSDQITADGGKNVDRISQFITPELFKDESKSADELSASERHTEGKSSFTVSGLQQYVDGHDGTAILGLYICVDVTNVRVVDSAGKDATSASRIDKVPLEVEFRVTTQPKVEVLVAKNSPWSGKDFCE